MKRRKLIDKPTRMNMSRYCFAKPLRDIQGFHLKMMTIFDKTVV